MYDRFNFFIFVSVLCANMHNVFKTEMIECSQRWPPSTVCLYSYNTISITKNIDLWRQNINAYRVVTYCTLKYQYLRSPRAVHDIYSCLIVQWDQCINV